MIDKSMDDKYFYIQKDFFDRCFIANAIAKPVDPICERMAWLFLICKADNEGICITNFTQLSIKWIWSVPKVKGFLDKLCLHNSIEFEKIGRKIKITIKDYDKYIRQC